MKTNELRLGNYILVDCVMFKEKLKVTEICPDGVFANTKYPNIPEIVFVKKEDIEPIELTEKVLLKIGFVKENEVNRMYNNRCVVSYYIGNFYKELVIEVRRENGFYKNNMVHYDIKYLHELQNAYYLLTGKELEVEL